MTHATSLMTGPKSGAPKHQAAEIVAIHRDLPGKERAKEKERKVQALLLHLPKVKAKARKENLLPDPNLPPKEVERPVVFEERCREPSMYQARPELSRVVSLLLERLIAHHAKLILKVTARKGLSVENGIFRTANGGSKICAPQAMIAFSTIAIKMARSSTGRVLAIPLRLRRRRRREARLLRSPPPAQH